MKGIKGKVVIVTGGGSGIGRASATLFAELGASVVVADINQAAGQTTADNLKERGLDALFIACDARQQGDVEQLVAQTVEAYGAIHCAHINVGGGIPEASDPIGSIAIDQWNQEITLNLTTAFLSLRFIIPQIVACGGGSIVATSSLAGLMATRSNPGYIAAKHAIVGLTRHAALTYGPQKVRVNAICPGAINTDMVKAHYSTKVDDYKSFFNNNPLGRIGEPEDIAGAVVWLCSDYAAFVTGVALEVDGGMSITALESAQP